MGPRYAESVLRREKDTERRSGAGRGWLYAPPCKKPQKPPEPGRGEKELQREGGPAHTLLSDVWPPEL